MKTNFSKLAVLIAALCTLLLVVSGCNLFGPDVSGVNKETGNITLSINGADTFRTIFPQNVVFDYYIVTIYNVDQSGSIVYNEEWHDGKVSDSIALPIGFSYQISAAAYINDLYAAGGDSVIGNLSPSGAAININLEPAADGGGTFTWDITLDDSITNAAIMIEGRSLPIILKGSGATTENSLYTDKGVYRITINLYYDCGAHVVVPEYLHIYQAMTSHYQKVFGSYSVVTLLEYVINAVSSGNWNDLTIGLFTDLEIGITFGTANFANVRSEFADLVTADGVPANLAGLKALVDAALVINGIAASYESQDDAEEAVTGLIQNGTSVGYVLAGQTLFITIGSYNITTAVIPPPIVIGDWTWVSFNDSHEGGTSTIDLTQGEGSLNDRVTISGTITNDIPNGGYANWEIIPNTAALAELKTAGAISFEMIGDGREYIFKLVTPDVTDYRFHQVVFEAPDGQNTIYISLVNLYQPNWGTGSIDVPFNQNNVTSIQMQPAGTDWDYDYEVTMWDLQFHVPPRSITGNMGQYQYGHGSIIGTANLQQASWILSGTTFDSFKNADLLIIQLGEDPTANLELSWQEKSTEGNWYDGWNNTIIYTSDIYQNGASYEDGVLTIDLALAIADYADFLTQSDVKLIFSHYDGGNINDLDIISANFGSANNGNILINIDFDQFQELAPNINGGTVFRTDTGPARPGSATLTANPPAETTYDEIEWRVNNIPETGVTNTFDFNAAGRGIGGPYYVTVRVRIGTVWYSQTVEFTVAP